MNKKEKLFAFLTDQAKVPYLAEEIAVMLGAEDNLSELTQLLCELETEGEIIKSRRGRYEAAKKQGIYCAVYRANPKGFGFVYDPDGDFYISAENRGTALSGDTVRMRIVSGNGHSREGQIIDVINRANETAIGIYRGGSVYAGAIFADIAINEPSATFENCRVVVKITDYEKLHGDVIVNLGLFESTESEMLAIMHEFGISQDFPQEVLDDAEKSARAERNTEKRRDLRSLLTVTIDGADARDLDDAISVVQEEDALRLYVHIADVSEYVTRGSEIDKEAFQRGTSCYFPDRVCPMLPQVLSNGVCSLSPDADRLAVTTSMKIGTDGSVLSYEIFESVIKSDFRLVYDDVTQLLEDDKNPLWEKYEVLREMLRSMERLAKKLRKRRFEKGSIDFKIPEPKVIIDADGKVTDVFAENATVSHKIIEEFMLICNKTLAEHAYWASLPFVYRVHEDPDRDKMEEFRKFINLFGFTIPGRATGRRLMSILGKCEGQPFERAVNTVLLRCMSKARYDAENLGHFGLGAQYYCHFTSPIRRYPDLVCHRIIKMSLRGEKVRDMTEFAVRAAEQSSKREMDASDAERDAVRLKICEYMEQHIGEEFDAVISSVTSFGFFAELPSCIEGLVRVEDITDDYYEFDESTYSLRGERRGKTYKIGDSVRVLAARVDREARYIDFTLGGGKWKKK